MSATEISVRFSATVRLCPWVYVPLCVCVCVCAPGHVKGEGSSFVSWYSSISCGIVLSWQPPCHGMLSCPPVCPPELMALAELIGPYGIRLVGEKLMEQISSQTKEIKRLVVANRDTLLSMLQNKDKPELFQEAARRLRSQWGCCGRG